MIRSIQLTILGENNRALGLLYGARYQIQYCGLSGSIRSDESEKLTLFYLEADVVHGL